MPAEILNGANYSKPMTMDFGVDMIEVPDMDLGLMKYYGNDYVNQRIALTKLDNDGNVQWVQIYRQVTHE